MVTKKTNTKKLSNTVKLNITMTVALCGVAGFLTASEELGDADRRRS